MDEDQVLFELGFVDSESAKNQINELATAVEQAQDRMSGVFKLVATQAEASIKVITQAAMAESDKISTHITNLVNSVTMSGNAATGGAASGASGASGSSSNASPSVGVQEIQVDVKINMDSLDNQIRELEKKAASLIPKIDVRGIESAVKQLDDAMQGFSSSEPLMDLPEELAKLRDMVAEVHKEMEKPAFQEWAKDGGLSLDELTKKLEEAKAMIADPETFQINFPDEINRVFGELDEMRKKLSTGKMQVEQRDFAAEQERFRQEYLKKRQEEDDWAAYQKQRQEEAARLDREASQERIRLRLEEQELNRKIADDVIDQAQRVQDTVMRVSEDDRNSPDDGLQGSIRGMLDAMYEVQTAFQSNTVEQWSDRSKAAVDSLKESIRDMRELEASGSTNWAGALGDDLMILQDLMEDLDSQMSNRDGMFSGMQQQAQTLKTGIEKSINGYLDEVKSRSEANEAATRAEMQLLSDLRDEHNRVRDAVMQTTAAHEENERQFQEFSDMSQQGMHQVRIAATHLATSLGKIGRGAALLGFANSSDAQKALENLAKVQAAIDLIGGGVQAIRSVSAMFEGLRRMIVGSTVARAAEAQAAQLATAASNAHAEAMMYEMRAAEALATQLQRTNAARAAAGLGPRDSVTPYTDLGIRGPRSLAGGVAGSAAGRAANAIAGGGGSGDVAGAALGGAVSGLTGSGVNMAGDFVTRNIGRLGGRMGTAGVGGMAAVVAAIAALTSVVAADHRDRTDGMSEEERRKKRTLDEKGSAGDMFMEFGSAINATLDSYVDAFTKSEEEYKKSRKEAEDATASFVESMGVGVFKFVDMITLRAFDLLGRSAAEASEALMEFYKQADEASQRIQAIGIRGQAQLNQNESSANQSLLRNRLDAVSSDLDMEPMQKAEERTRILAEEEAKLADEIRVLREALTDEQGGISADFTGNQAHAAQDMADLDALIDKNKQLQDLTSDRIAAQEAMATAAKQAASEEIRALEELVKIRERLKEQQEQHEKSAMKAYAQLSRSQQARLKEAMEAFQAGTQTDRDVAVLERFRSPGTEKMLEAHYKKKAEEEGFGEVADMLLPDKQKAEEEYEKAINDLAEKSGVAAETIRERLDEEFRREPLILAAEIQIDPKYKEEIERLRGELETLIMAEKEIRDAKTKAETEKEQRDAIEQEYEKFESEQNENVPAHVKLEKKEQLYRDAGFTEEADQIKGEAIKARAQKEREENAPGWTDTGFAWAQKAVRYAPLSGLSLMAAPAVMSKAISDDVQSGKHGERVREKAEYDDAKDKARAWVRGQLSQSDTGFSKVLRDQFPSMAEKVDNMLIDRSMKEHNSMSSPEWLVNAGVDPEQAKRVASYGDKYEASSMFREGMRRMDEATTQQDELEAARRSLADRSPQSSSSGSGSGGSATQQKIELVDRLEMKAVVEAMDERTKEALFKELDNVIGQRDEKIKAMIEEYAKAQGAESRQSVARSQSASAVR